MDRRGYEERLEAHFFISVAQPKKNLLRPTPNTWDLEAAAALAALPKSDTGVRRDKAALSSGCEPHPATAPAGSNRSSHGGNEVAEAFD